MLSPSREANILLAILSKINPVCNFPYYFFKRHFNIILPPMPRPFKWSVLFIFTHQCHIWTSLLPHTCFMSCPSQPSKFYNQNNTQNPLRSTVPSVGITTHIPPVIPPCTAWYIIWCTLTPNRYISKWNYVCTVVQKEMNFECQIRQISTFIFWRAVAHLKISGTSGQCFVLQPFIHNNYYWLAPFIQWF